ncbi:MAG: peptidase M23 [Lachnospiraceae bacterium]|nr:peptidase M23 [Lachnospiraceae bacterium]
MMKKRLIAISMSLLLCATLSVPMDTSATSVSKITSDSIKDKQNQISQAEKEKEQMENQITDLQKVKKELETQKANLKDYVAELDNNLSAIEQNIIELKAQIANKETEIALTETELEAAQDKEEKQKDFLFKSIKLSYEKDDSYMVDMLLRAENFGDFLNRADFIDTIVTYEQQMWEEYITNRELIELCKQELELEKQILDQAKVNVETEQANLESLIEQKNQDIVAYESDISNKEQAIKEYEEAIKEQDAEIEALEAAIAEEKKQLLASNGNVITYDGGQFKFPLASYTRISDDYGMRMHPTLHVEQFHNGVDFAAPKGTAIYAAYDGKVVAATYSATMGNYVMIDHGDNLYTIYMHASALYVSKGDIVVRGETIAAVGTTGRSTGNHLHFGVRKDGSYVSPWNYLSE